MRDPRGTAKREKPRRAPPFFGRSPSPEKARAGAPAFLAPKARRPGLRVRFSFWFFAVVGLFALLDHRALFFYIALPVAVHELGHLLVMLACGIPVREIAFTPVSIRVTAGPGRLSYRRELLVAAGGIAANLLAALALRLLAFQSVRAMLAVSSNLAVAFFSLLPVGSLDGGQMMRILCDGLFGPGLARKISIAVSFAVLVPLIAAAVWLLLREERNFTLAATCVYLAAVVIWQEK